MEKEKLEKTFLEKKLVMKEMTRSLADSERAVDRLMTEQSLLMMTNKELLSCSSQKTTNGNLIRDKVRNIIRKCT